MRSSAISAFSKLFAAKLFDFFQASLYFGIIRIFLGEVRINFKSFIVNALFHINVSKRTRIQTIVQINSATRKRSFGIFNKTCSHFIIGIAGHQVIDTIIVRFIRFWQRVVFVKETLEGIGNFSVNGIKFGRRSRFFSDWFSRFRFCYRFFKFFCNGFFCSNGFFGLFFRQIQIFVFTENAIERVANAILYRGFFNFSTRGFLAFITKEGIKSTIHFFCCSIFFSSFRSRSSSLIYRFFKLFCNRLFSSNGFFQNFFSGGFFKRFRNRSFSRFFSSRSFFVQVQDKFIAFFQQVFFIREIHMGCRNKTFCRSNIFSRFRRNKFRSLFKSSFGFCRSFCNSLSAIFSFCRSFIVQAKVCISGLFEQATKRIFI